MLWTDSTGDACGVLLSCHRDSSIPFFYVMPRCSIQSVVGQRSLAELPETAPLNAMPKLTVCAPHLRVLRCALQLLCGGSVLAVNGAGGPRTRVALAAS